MFDNIGNKIKTLAQIIAWVGIIGSVLIGIIQMMGGNTGLGFIILLGGSLISWTSSWFLYGFGELIDKTVGIYMNITDSNSTTNIRPFMKKCPNCKGAHNPEYQMCPRCGYPYSDEKESV